MEGEISLEMEVTKKLIGDVVREKCGIVERVYCVRCGRNLPWLEYDCPVCKGEKEKMKPFVDKERLDDSIRGLVNQIGAKCRGRIEIDHGDRVNVIEFEGDGKWRRTGYHDKGADYPFSMFREFRSFEAIEKLARSLMDALYGERNETI